MTLVSKFQSDLTQQKASFAATIDGFDIIVHVPAFPHGAEMNIYRHLGLPLPVDHTHQMFVTTPFQYLAINSDGTLFKAMSAADLRTCKQLGEFYACGRDSVVRRSPYHPDGH